ncbi:MAG: fibrobacter succinogenes major paralogous domain-containing protein [Fibromonadaceae bacterium]|jgi:uncharacterized protein (TIGR02145 family)|nr:fibrobacter succinogenes major paralogous domain-containing protein [Fibromonadaceae bacterium]
MKKVIVLLMLFSTVVFAQQKGVFTDPRDGKTYKSVTIGKQTWMAENLNYHGEDGFLGLCYGDKPQKKIREPENCEKYGRLYDWEEAKQACPKGWHLPSVAEWNELINFAGDNVAGKKLKAKNGWEEYSCKWTEEEKIDNRGRVIAPITYDRCATDEFGFTALPGGYGLGNGDFGDVNIIGHWWSASRQFDNGVYYCYMKYNSEYALVHWQWKAKLFSVRCVRD